MALLSLFGKKPVPAGGALYSLHCDIHPYRLPAHKAEFAELEIKLENSFEKELLTSLVIVLPKNIGFDQTGLQTEREIRLGMLQSRQLHHATIKIWAAPRTPPGAYPIRIHAISHYRDYGYVLGQVTKTVDLRVV